MNTATFEVDVQEARRKYLQYFAACKESPTADLVLLKRIYRELSLGHRIINANEEIAKAGHNKNGLPFLAIAKAHEPWCRLEQGHVRRGREKVYVWRFASEPVRAPGKRWPEPSFRWEVPRQVVPRPRVTADGRLVPENRSFRAMVPMIPPNLRPAGDLSKYWIMWEAEWSDVPPIDPILLRQIDGPFFVVLAHWDLTDVERSVLGVMRHEGH